MNAATKWPESISAYVREEMSLSGVCTSSKSKFSINDVMVMLCRLNWVGYVGAIVLAVMSTGMLINLKASRCISGFSKPLNISKLAFDPQKTTTPPLINASRNAADLPPERKYTSLFYLKTHKTASTSVARLLYSYARRHKLSTLQRPGEIFITSPNHRGDRSDAIVGHHMVYNWTVINSYLRRPPDLVLTSIRLPLQRQLSWFRQQNREFDTLLCPGRHTPRSNANVSMILSAFDDFVSSHETLGSQWSVLSERNSVLLDAKAILDQFSFVLLKERLSESLMCLCRESGIRLCSEERELPSLNVAARSSCVERVLINHRSSVLVRGSERDLLLYEIVNERITKCMNEIPSWCKCR